MAGPALGRLGWRAVIIEGQAPAGQGFVLVIDAGGGRLEPADDLAGLPITAAARRLQDRYFAARSGRQPAVIRAGVAGERLMAAAGVAVTDADGLPTRYAGRGGLGATMGPKGLKAVVIRWETAPARRPQDPEAWGEAVRRYHGALRASEDTADMFPKCGTAITLEAVDSLGGLPTRGFRVGRFEAAAAIGGRSLRKTILARGGEGTATHACMPGCLVRCSNRFAGERGKLITGPLEYETNALCGSNLGLGSLAARGANRRRTPFLDNLR